MSTVALTQAGAALEAVKLERLHVLGRIDTLRASILEDEDAVEDAADVLTVEHAAEARKVTERLADARRMLAGHESLLTTIEAREREAEAARARLAVAAAAPLLAECRALVEHYAAELGDALVQFARLQSLQGHFQTGESFSRSSGSPAEILRARGIFALGTERQGGLYHQFPDVEHMTAPALLGLLTTRGDNIAAALAAEAEAEELAHQESPAP